MYSGQRMQAAIRSCTKCCIGQLNHHHHGRRKSDREKNKNAIMEFGSKVLALTVNFEGPLPIHLKWMVFGRLDEVFREYDMAIDLSKKLSKENERKSETAKIDSKN